MKPSAFFWVVAVVVGVTSVLVCLVVAVKPDWEKTYVSKWNAFGSTYRTECHCVERLEGPGGVFRNTKCRAIKSFKIRRIKRSRMGYSRHVLRGIIQRPTDFRQVNIRSASFSCSEGREPMDDQSLRTPGGDFAEFVYFLTMYEQRHALNRKLQQGDVDSLFFGYLQWMKPHWFYYHTDEAATNRLKETLIQNEGFDPGELLDLSNPPQDLTDAILREIIKPEYQGCTHLKLMMYYPTEFGISLRAAQMLIRSYFQLLWDNDRIGVGARGQNDEDVEFLLRTRLKYVSSVGYHQHGAWIESWDDAHCNDANVASIFAPVHDYPVQKTTSVAATKQALGLSDPNTGKPKKQLQVYVEHPQAVPALRANLATFLEARDPPKDAAEDTVAIHKIAVHAIKTFKAFATRNLPIYTLTTSGKPRRRR